MKREVAIIYHDHLDPEWARCLERPVMCNSVLLRSYADLWDWIIGRYLELAEQGYRYTEGQYLVWRTYLKRHPEKRPLIKEKIRSRKLEVLLQGELTPDTNIVPAEGLARNYLLASAFYDEFCGEDYPGTKFAWVFDTFGNSANMPQILKLAGAEAVGGTKYRVCPDDIWVGIDGTKLPCIDAKTGFSDIYSPNSKPYYRLCRQVHCKACNGRGCAACAGRGFIEVHAFEKDVAKAMLLREAAQDEPLRFVLIGGEEVIPNQCILDAINELNAEHADVHFRFGDFSEFWAHNKAYYESKLNDFTQPTEELNPVHQGCYVTRIANKQKTRSITYDLIRLEALLASNAWQSGAPAFPPADLVTAWQNLLLNMHHDSISGAHIDSGRDELMDYLRETESIISQYMPKSFHYRAHRAMGKETTGLGEQTKRLGCLDIRYDVSGIRTVTQNGVDLFGQFRYEHQTNFDSHTDYVRVGELLLQSDWGDNHNAFVLGDIQPLGNYQYAVYDNGDHLWWRGKHETGDPGVKRLSWEVRVRASEDGERLDFEVTVHWDTLNKRLRIAVPVDGTRKDAVWEIPYGFLRRTYDPENIRPYGHGRQVIATRPIGEYPALHWVMHDIDEARGVAILNKGIPSVKWTPGCFELSILRSPMMTGDTVFPSVEEVWDISDTYDAGRHRFEFSVWPYTDRLSFGDITRAGYAYNCASPGVPFDVDGDVVITSFKLSEDGAGYVLRVQEAGGKAGQVELRFDSPYTITSVNFMEKPLSKPETAKTKAFPLRKHEILTVKIVKPLKEEQE